MSQIVPWSVPLFPSFSKLASEHDCSLFFTHIQEQLLLNELDWWLVKLFQITDNHQHKQVDKDICILANLQESLDRQLLKGFFVVVRWMICLVLVFSILLPFLLFGISEFKLESELDFIHLVPWIDLWLCHWNFFFFLIWHWLLWLLLLILCKLDVDFSKVLQEVV